MAPSLHLVYFDIEGVAEKVRLTLLLGGVAFQDERINFKDWSDPAVKQRAPYGQLPFLTVDGGAPITQSEAMLRYAGKLTKLYPEDFDKALKVDEIVGLQGDMARAIAPSIYVGMRPHVYGYAEDLPEAERKAIQGRLRETLLKDDIPRFLGYFEEKLVQNGTGFFVGDCVTIADCVMLPQLRQLKSGRLDGIPTDIVDGYPKLSEFYRMMMDIPCIRNHYEKH
ncbi:hypothetical protein GUITHDRAFT_153127 [Guillardia theta CCMP2712]|uniref:Glutathione S-transferase n=1 Tax=Guillardia theta (strain CCMP2712) TaxID=905079 RepID=L1J663_GUITC|nr:hypothetical protein GUITHDRAFT_153127 [Guillardia theta CCMP2712]EKX44006.1 hypothetical protein GUITHDRAFT_153127 [Guillardia theta CCMP2712]|eukprot:XP_005830986.1 hypothetical protein GUITHDRAFT_153127 [Guillardia theta CCMP2712]